MQSWRCWGNQVRRQIGGLIPGHFSVSLDQITDASGPLSFAILWTICNVQRSSFHIARILQASRIILYIVYDSVIFNHGCSPIQGTKFNFCLNLMKPGVWLFSNPEDKVQILVESTGEICTVLLHLFWTLSPGFENNHTFKCWSGIFSNNLDIYDYVVKLPEKNTFHCMVVLQYRGLNFIFV